MDLPPDNSVHTDHSDSRKKPALIGLTGGIGSGKSTVAQLFSELGACTASADDIARTLVEPGSPKLSEIVRLFGNSILNSQGCLDRPALAEIVFSDSQKRKKLEAILHPAIRKELYRYCAQCQFAYCVLEIPLLIESGDYTDLDRIVVVTSSSDVRQKRLNETRGMDPCKFREIVETQLSDEDRIAVADDVIRNDGDLESLLVQVKALHCSYIRLFGS